jgi:hypothetical protein
MLINTRTYSLSQTPDRGYHSAYSHNFYSLTGWRGDSEGAQKVSEMLLVHQAGRVHVGEVIRFVIENFQFSFVELL